MKLHLFSAIALFTLTSSAQADLAAWLAAVAAGTTPTYTGSNILIPTEEDIGVISIAGGATYEFVVNATNDGLSSALMGAKNTGFGNNAALKFEQYPDTMQFGITQWGVIDIQIAPNVENQDIHLAFVIDSANNSTELYMDGVSIGTATFAPHITGLTGIGHWYDPGPGVSVDPLTGSMHGVATYDSMLSPSEIAAHSGAFHGAGGLGTQYCTPAALNTTGVSAEITALGSLVAANNDVTLVASGLPSNQFGIFLTSLTQGFIPNPGGSMGNLCLSGAIGRYNGPGQTLNSGAGGAFSLVLDLAATPTPSGPVAILPNNTWHFQAWYRDFITGQGPTSNFTDATSLLFQ